MIKKTFILIALAATTLQASADNFLKGLVVKTRRGYNIGGTAPLPMPASIRKLNSYSLKANWSLGIDATKPLDDHWGVMVGLRFEAKGMKEDAEVKNYHEVMVQGDQTLEGRFTGSVTTNVRQWMFTLPVQASLKVAHNIDLRFGPYVSVLTSKGFSGYAHDGYLRVGDPTGAKVIIGNKPGNMGYYNFSSDMRTFQWGVGVGADWIFWRNWGLYGEVNWGLSGLHKSSFHVLDQTLYPIYGQVGLVWKATKKAKKAKREKRTK